MGPIRLLLSTRESGFGSSRRDVIQWLKKVICTETPGFYLQREVGDRGLSAAASAQEAAARAKLGAGMSSAGVFSSSLQTSHRLFERGGAFGHASIL